MNRSDEHSSQTHSPQGRARWRNRASRPLALQTDERALRERAVLLGDEQRTAGLTVKAMTKTWRHPPRADLIRVLSVDPQDQVVVQVSGGRMNSERRGLVDDEASLIFIEHL